MADDEEREWYVTKWALRCGIVKRTGRISDGVLICRPPKFARLDWSWDAVPKRLCFRHAIDAIDAAYGICDRKIRFLQKQIAKLEALRIEVVDG